MAKRAVKWLYNINGSPGPWIVNVPFQAGSSATIDEGAFLEISGGNFIELATDKAMAGTVAISLEEIKSGDHAGYYPAIIPRPGDVFECKLATGADDQSPARGDTVFVSDKESVTTTNGSNVFGAVVDHDGMPKRSGHASDDASIAEGTTIVNVPNNRVLIMIKEGASYFNQLQLDDA